MTSIYAFCAASHRAAVQVYLEDAGFDWKVMGPDVANLDYVAWQCDQVCDTACLQLPPVQLLSPASPRVASVRAASV